MSGELPTLSESIESLEVMPLNAIESIQRAEIDTQITTAKRYPRSLASFKVQALEMVAMDEETAASCIYRRPVGKEKNPQGKWVEKHAEGMSIRMAEIVSACYGNIRSGAMIIEQTERQVKVRGSCHDLQNNVATGVEVVEATITTDGKPYNERMRIVIAKSALAKATRDAIFRVVPRALCRPIEEMARKVAIGDAKSLHDRRDKVMAWLTKIGVDASRAFAALGIKGLEDLTSEHLVTLTGYKTAIKDGEITVEEAFPIEPKRADSSFEIEGGAK